MAKSQLGLCQKSANVAANEIRGAFNWDATPQGFDYWEEVVKNLEKLARRGNRKRPAEAHEGSQSNG